jgi:hypothetical protein
MSVAISQAQKQRYRITLDIEVLEDFDPHQISWEDLFDNSTSKYYSEVDFISVKKIRRENFLWKRFITSMQRKSVYTII